MRFPQSQLTVLYQGAQHVANRTVTTARLCPRQRGFHQTSVAFRPRQRSFFTSNQRLARDAGDAAPGPPTAEARAEQAQQQRQDHRQQQHHHLREESSNSADGTTTKTTAAAPAATITTTTTTKHNNRKGKVSASGTKKKLRDPLRRVASIAQRAGRRPAAATRGGEAEPGKDYRTTICAICVAESFDMKAVVRALHHKQYLIDPDGLDFDDEEVIHVRPRGPQGGDLFIFETGTVVTWSLPPERGIDLATDTLLPAHENPHTSLMDRDEMTERLEFEVDPGTAHSSMRGDTVMLGTRRDDGDLGPHHGGSGNGGGDLPEADAGRAKIAFSSGLARSTKVAVLEALLNSFLERTEEFPAQLQTGRLRVAKAAILRLTGELQHLRSQLNFFSELTDSLPDKFWDQRAELRLDGIYDQVGKALDVPSRIRVLNQRMDYAADMLATVREMLDQEHGSRLEWIIIWLIAVEVAFHLIDWAREYRRAVKDEGRTASARDSWEWLVGLS